MHDPKWNTSLYNHKPISDGKLPLIANAEFKQLLERLPTEPELYELYKSLYVFEPKQEKIITDILNNRII